MYMYLTSHFRGVGKGGGRGGGGGWSYDPPFLGATFIHFLYKVLGLEISAKLTILKINI